MHALEYLIERLKPAVRRAGEIVLLAIGWVIVGSLALFFGWEILKDVLALDWGLLVISTIRAGVFALCAAVVYTADKNINQGVAFSVLLVIYAAMLYSAG